MKKMVVNTRKEYYLGMSVGLVIAIGLVIWFLGLSITHGGFDLSSLFFWLGLILLGLIPFALIMLFSSMKSVEVNSTGLIISYIFQKHINEIRFSEVKEFKSRTAENKARSSQRPFRDTFKLVLVDGRVFEFDRSQFDNYDQLKAICRKNVRGSAS
jgi:hypothetical protein